MFPNRILLVLINLLATSFVFAETATPEATATETAAFGAITELMQKFRQGGDKPSDADLQTHRDAGKEMAKKAEQFLKDFPASRNCEDAQGLWNIGLFQAAIAGDSDAAQDLQIRATECLQDPKMPAMMKLHIFGINHTAQWAGKNGKRHLDQGSAEFQQAYTEAFFAAADVLSNKEDIFKMLLLQAKSGRELSTEDKQSIARRVLNHSNAPPAIKAEASNILAGEKTYAIGKPLDISFTAVDGRKVNLTEMKGKVVLIDFWATWCGPCVAEVPELKRAYDKLHGDGFEIVGISLDDKKEDLLRFTKKHEMAWPQYFDGKHWNNDLSFRFGINSVPTHWLVDKQGILRQTNVRANLEQAVRSLLAEK